MERNLRICSFFIFSIFLLNCSISYSQNKIESFERLLQNTRVDSARVRLLNTIAEEYIETDTVQAMAYALKAFELAEQTSDDKGKAKAYINIAYVYFERSMYKEAHGFFEQALPILEKTNDLKAKAATLGDIGVVLKYLGEHQTALSYYHISLNIYEQLQDKAGLASSYNNIGRIYERLGQFDKAVEYYQQAINLFKILNDKDSENAALNNLAITYEQQEKYDEALVIFIRLLEVAKETRTIKLIAKYSNNVGHALMLKKEYSKALEYLNVALQLRESSGDKTDAAFTLYNIGAIYLEQNKPAKALEYIEEGLQIVISRSIKPSMIKGYKYMSEIYKQQNNYKKSLDYFELYSNLKDNVFNETSSKQITEMSAKYETEKKEKEIALLNKDKSLQETQINQQKTIRNFLFGLSGLILTLAVVTFAGYRNKRKANNILNNQKEEIILQRDQIEKQKLILEEKNKEVTDSIYYARRIQRALLTSDKYLKENLPDHFVYYQPKDIVSGDFYWSISLDAVKGKKTNKNMVAIADCTGHGVPGAFMSMIGISFLNEIVVEKKITEPQIVLNELRKSIINALNPEGSFDESKDGMDIALFTLDSVNKTVEFAGANISLYLVRENSLNEIKPDKFPIGMYGGELKDYSLKKFTLQENDRLYCFSDGYPDQFGGPKGKKFKYKNIEELIVKIADTPMQNQKLIIEKTHTEWKGNFEQIDDILFMGITV